MALIALLILLPLTACTTQKGVTANDPFEICVLPQRPECASRVCTDKESAVYTTQLGEKIELCRGLLGHDNIK